MDGGSKPGQVVNPGDEESPEVVDQTEEMLVADSGAHTTSDEIPAEDYASTARQPEFRQEILDNDQSIINWTASEFIEHDKSGAWFSVLAIITVAISAIVYFLTREWFAVVIAILLAVIFGIGAARRPRVLEYAITAAGISIGQKNYPFENFRAFGVVNEGPVESIVLLPSKRWNPAINLYFAPEDGDKIVDALGSAMPFEEREAGLADKFLHKIRF